MLLFESGHYECERAYAAIVSISTSAAIRRCVAYAFEHVELTPLFEYLRESSSTSRPLLLSGLDLQTQGADSRERPAWFRSELSTVAPNLADRIAFIDSTLLARTSAGPDSLAAWVRADGRAARALYDSAAARANGSLQWTLRGGSTLLERLLAREDARVAGQPAPVRHYAIRDEWMARTVARYADSLGVKRKVIAWVHNDHARYGSWDTPSGPARATGGLLRERYPESVFSIGFFMGSGSVANNSRQTRPMIAPPPGSIERTLARPGTDAGYLVLAGSARRWAQLQHPYLRNGLAIDSMIPAREFDALIYIDRVNPATYGLR